MGKNTLSQGYYILDYFNQNDEQQKSLAQDQVNCSHLKSIFSKFSFQPIYKQF